MKSYSAFFVPTEKKEAAARAFGSGRLLSECVLIPGSDWAVCCYRRDSPPPDDEVLRGRASLTQEKSRELGEVLYLFADSRPASFVYEHAKAGALLRKLVYFELSDSGPAWLCADGTPEGWEDRLFAPMALESTLACERENLKDRGESSRFPALEAEILRVWVTRAIRTMSPFPRTDGGAADFVERHYGLRRP